MIKREAALVRSANKAGTDLTGKEGHVAVNDGGLALAATATLAKSFGVIAEGGEIESDVAICGAFAGTVGLKAGGAVKKFDRLAVRDGGTVAPSADGKGTFVAVALEDAAADEIFEAALITPATVA